MKTAIHALGCLIGLAKPHTQTTQAERNCLAAYAAGKHRIVELGVFEGVATNVLGNSMSSEGVLYAVDPFIPGQLGFCWSELIARKEAWLARRNIVFVKLLSEDAARIIEGNFDMSFVDADHSIEGITQDRGTWSSRIVQGGIIALHDTRVPEHDPSVATLGSYKVFEEDIRHDDRLPLSSRSID